MKKILAAALCASLLPGALGATEVVLSAASFAFPSIQQGGGARAIGLGSTYVGIAEGSTALLWNPAGLALLPKAEVSLHHNSALLGSNQEMALLGLPLGSSNGLGLGLNYQDNGAFEGRDGLGNPTGNYTTRNFGANLGWGIRGPAGVAVGLALKGNRMEIAGSSFDAFAGDLGLLWSPSPNFNVGAAYTNLGPDSAGRQLAQGVRVGLASYLNKCSDFQWLLALSGESLTRDGSSAHAGIEATVKQILALRAGYNLDLASGQNSGVAGWTLGGGILLKQLSLDYAYVPLTEGLGAMQRVSLTYNFGERCQSGSAAAEAPKEAKAELTALPEPALAPVPMVVAVVVPPAPAEPLYPGSYVVTPGDSLWSIAAKDDVMADPYRWPLLFKANRDTIEDPDLISPEEQLRFKEHYSQEEAGQAVEKAQDTPLYLPHTASRKLLPVKY